MGYGKRKSWKRTPIRRFSKYLHGAIGAASGGALGYIRNNIAGGLAGIGGGWAAGRAYYRRNWGLNKKVMKHKLGSNISGRFKSGGAVTGSNPGHVFGSNPGPKKPGNQPKPKGGWTGTDIWARGRGHRKGHSARRKSYPKF